MRTIETSNIPVEQLDTLEQLASEHFDDELRDVLLSLSSCVKDGATLVAVDPSETLTPSQAADRLGMSRTHLYKLLDRGEIMSHRVGRDRRIAMRDLVEFEMQRRQDKCELAERFAHQSKTRAGAVDELANLL